MGQTRNLICLLLAATLIGLVESEIDIKNPVRSANEDEVTDLPNLTFKPNFKQFSGYLEADDKRNRFWHYWFVESQSNPATDPLVLWLNGGPGCSSLLGLLTELGPFRVAANMSVIGNPYAWNKRANVIFMESPAGVGYSYAVNGDVTADDDTTAKQNHLALRSFLRKFPQYKNNELYLTGESYGGVYLPTLGVLVDEDPEMNLKGIAIGNGYLNAPKLAESLVYFSYYHGLVGRSTWEGLSKYCCDGKPPARGDCNIVSPDRSQQCSSFVLKATDEIVNSGLNPYNLYDQCEGADSSARQMLSAGAASPNYRSYRESVERRLVLSAFNLTSSQESQDNKRRTFHQSKRQQHNRLDVLGKPLRKKLAGDPPCTDDSIPNAYLNKQEVRRALHIPEELKTEFATCFEAIQYTMIYPNQPDGLAPQMRKLIDSERNLTLLVYNGDIDLMCNFFGDEWFVDDLGRRVIRDWDAWFTNRQLSGFSKYFDGITYFTVKGSGHMVPTDRPAEALNMFEQFLDGLKPNDV